MVAGCLVPETRKPILQTIKIRSAKWSNGLSKQGYSLARRGRGIAGLAPVAGCYLGRSLQYAQWMASAMSPASLSALPKTI